MTILLTGLSGFLGPAVAAALRAGGDTVVAAVRRPLPETDLPTRLVGDLGDETDWRAALAGCDRVVHMAARAHVMKDEAADPLAVFRRVNRDGTLALAEQAAAAGIGHFLFVSSIKVNGEATSLDRPFRAEDAAAPQDAYGRAKAEAEDGLRAIAARTGMGLTIIRPPLVHGPGAKGNLAALLRVLNKGWPLPLGAIGNRRSLVGVVNLAHAIGFLLAGRHQGTFLIRDDEDISTTELLRRLSLALGRSPRLLPVPAGWLRLAATVLGRSDAIERLTGSLTVDDTPLRRLGWTPPQTLDQGLSAMARALTASPIDR